MFLVSNGFRIVQNITIFLNIINHINLILGHNIGGSIEYDFMCSHEYGMVHIGNEVPNGKTAATVVNDKHGLMQ